MNYVASKGVGVTPVDNLDLQTAVIIEAGADVSYSDDAALAQAIGHGYLRVVKYLVSVGGTVNSHLLLSLRLTGI